MAKKKLYLEQKIKSMDKMSEDEIKAAQSSRWPVEYVVKKVVGNITPEVHEVLDTKTALAFCEDEGWEVTIT
jgi:hypothetical protein